MADDSTFKDELRDYLQRGRDALLWKLDGLSDYDVRRPMTPTATNLLGLVKHVASCEAGYFGDTFGRPFPEPMPWTSEDAYANADMWATADETRDAITDLYRQVWAHSDETIQSLPLDATGRVPWWPADRATVTLQRVLVHMIGETERHAGHADIIREEIDGAAGIRAGRTNLPSDDPAWWAAYYERVDAAAQRFRTQPDQES